MRKAPEAASAALYVLLMDATDSTGSRFVGPGAAVTVAAPQGAGQAPGTYVHAN